MAKRKEFSTKGMDAFSNTISAIDSSNFKYTYFVYDETEYARLVLKGAAGDRVFIEGNVGDFNARVVGKTLYLSSTLGKQDIVISLSSATKTKAAKTTLYFLDGAYSFGGKTGKMSLGGKRLNSTEKDLGDLLKPTTNKTGAIYFGSESVFYSTERLSDSTDLLKAGTRDDLIIGNNATFNSEDRIDAGLGGKDKLKLDLAAQGGSILAGYVSNVEHLDLTAKANGSNDVVLDMERFDDQLQQINILDARANVKLLDQQSIADVFIQDTDKDIELNYDSQVVNGEEDVLNVTIDEFGHGAQSELTIDTGIETLNIDVRDGDHEASNIALTAAGVEKLVVTRGRDAQDFTLNADVEAGADFNSAAFVGNMDLTSSDIKTATFGAGDDTALIDGQANLSDSSYDLGEGDNEITIGRIADAIPPTTVGGSDGVPADTTGLALGGQILAGDGDNQVIVNGDLLATGSIALGNGDNFVSVRGGGTAGNGMVLGTVAAGNGDNTVTVTGDVAGESSITLGALGDGDNTLDVGGDIKDDATVQLGNGDNRVTVLGDIADNASVTLGDGANALTVGANIDGKAAVAFGNGDNVAKVVGVVTDDTQVEFGDGDNLMEVAGSVGNSDSTYLAGIAFGDGDNTLTVGGAVDTQSITLTKVVAATQMTFQFSTESGAVYRVAYDATGSFNPGTDQASRITFSKQATNGTFTTIPLPLTGQHAVEAAIAAEIGALNITFFDEPTDFMTIWAGVDYPKITSAVQINTATGSAYADSQATVTRVNGQFVDLGSTDSDGNVENATITFGDGTNFMQVDDDVISSSITFGGGANNSLDIGGSLIGDAVVFGNGAGNSFAIGEDVTNAASITLGNGGSSGSVDGVVNKGSTITFGSAADQLTIGDFTTDSPLVSGSVMGIQNVQISYDLTPDTATVIRMGGADDQVTLQSAGAGYVVSGGLSPMTPTPQGFLVESGGFIHGEGGSDDTFTVVTKQDDDTNVIGRTQDQKVEIELFKPDTESYQAGDIITISFSDGATALAPISYTVVDADIVQGNGVQTSANIADKVAAALNASLPFQAVFTAEAIDGTASTSPTGMTAVYLTSKNPHQDFTIESSHGTVTVMQISDARVTGFENVELVVENVATSGDGTTVQANFDLINGAQNILLDSQVQRIATVETFTSAGTDVDGPESLTNGAYTEYTPGGLTTFDLDNLQGGEKITVRGHETGAEGSCSDPDTGTGNQQVNRINVDARVDAHKIGDKITVEIGEVTMVYTVVAEDLVDGQTETVDADRIAAKLRDMINSKTAEHGFTAVVDTRETVAEATDGGTSGQGFSRYTGTYNDGAWVTLTGAADTSAVVSVAHTRTLVQTTAQATDGILVDGDAPAAATQASWDITAALSDATNKLLPGDVITVIRAAAEGVPAGTASYTVTAEDCLRLNADKIAAALAEQLGGTAEANWGVVSFGGGANLVVTRTTEPAVAISQTVLSGNNPLQEMTSTDDSVADVIIDATLADGAADKTMDLTVDGYGSFDIRTTANAGANGYNALAMTLADAHDHTVDTQGDVWKFTQTVDLSGKEVVATGTDVGDWVIDLVTEAGDTVRVAFDANAGSGNSSYTITKNGALITSGSYLQSIAHALDADDVTLSPSGDVLTVTVEQSGGNSLFSKIESVTSRATTADATPTTLPAPVDALVGNFSNSITVDDSVDTTGAAIELENVLAREVNTSASKADFTIDQYAARKDSTGVFSGETITVTTGTGDDHLTTLAQSALETGSSINLGTGSNKLSLGWGQGATIDSTDLEQVGGISYAGQLSQLDILSTVRLDKENTTLTMPGTDPVEKVTFTDVEAAVETKQVIRISADSPVPVALKLVDANGVQYRLVFDGNVFAGEPVIVTRSTDGGITFAPVNLGLAPSYGSTNAYLTALQNAMAAAIGAARVSITDPSGGITGDLATIWGGKGYVPFVSVDRINASTFAVVANGATLASEANALIGGNLTIAGTANDLSIESKDDFELTASGTMSDVTDLVSTVGTLTATDRTGAEITGQLTVHAVNDVRFNVGNNVLESLTVTAGSDADIYVTGNSDADLSDVDFEIGSLSITAGSDSGDVASFTVEGNTGTGVTLGQVDLAGNGALLDVDGNTSATVSVTGNVALSAVTDAAFNIGNAAAETGLGNDKSTVTVAGSVTLKANDDATINVDDNRDSNVTVTGDITIEGKGATDAGTAAALSVDGNLRTNVSLAANGTIDLVSCGSDDDAVVSVSGNVNDYTKATNGPDNGNVDSKSYTIALGDLSLDSGRDATVAIRDNVDSTYNGDLTVSVGNVDLFAYDDATLIVGGTSDGNTATDITVGDVDLRSKSAGLVEVSENVGQVYTITVNSSTTTEVDYADITLGNVVVDADTTATFAVDKNAKALATVGTVDLDARTNATFRVDNNDDSAIVVGAVTVDAVANVTFAITDNDESVAGTTNYPLEATVTTGSVTTKAGGTTTIAIDRNTGVTYVNGTTTVDRSTVTVNGSLTSTSAGSLTATVSDNDRAVITLGGTAADGEPKREVSLTATGDSATNTLTLASNVGSTIALASTTLAAQAAASVVIGGTANTAKNLSSTISFVDLTVGSVANAASLAVTYNEAASSTVNSVSIAGPVTVNGGLSASVNISDNDYMTATIAATASIRDTLTIDGKGTSTAGPGDATLAILGNTNSTVRLGNLDMDADDVASVSVSSNLTSTVSVGTVDIDAEGAAKLWITSNTGSDIEMASTRTTVGSVTTYTRDAVTIDAASVGAYQSAAPTAWGFDVSGNTNSGIYLGNIDISSAAGLQTGSDVTMRLDIAADGSNASVTVIDTGAITIDADSDVYFTAINSDAGANNSVLRTGSINITSGREPLVETAGSVTGAAVSSDLYFKASNLEGNDLNDNTGTGDDGQQITLTALSRTELNTNGSVQALGEGDVYANIANAPDLTALTVSGTNAEIYLTGTMGPTDSVQGTFTLDLSGMTGTFDTITTYNPLGVSADHNSAQDDGTYVVTVGATFDNDLRDMVVKIGTGDLVYNAQHSAFEGSDTDFLYGNNAVNDESDWGGKEGWFSLGTDLDLSPLRATQVIGNIRLGDNFDSNGDGGLLVVNELVINAGQRSYVVTWDGGGNSESDFRVNWNGSTGQSLDWLARELGGSNATVSFSEASDDDENYVTGTITIQGPSNGYDFADADLITGASLRGTEYFDVDEGLGISWNLVNYDETLTPTFTAGDAATDGLGNVASEVFRFTGTGEDMDIGDVVIGGFRPNGFFISGEQDRLDFSAFADIRNADDLIITIEKGGSYVGEEGGTGFTGDANGYFDDVIIDFNNQEYGSIRLVGVGEYFTDANVNGIANSIIFA